MSAKSRSISPDCYPCFFHQVLSLTTLCQLDDNEKRSVFEQCMTYLQQSHGQNVAVQHAIRFATDNAINTAQQADDFDPFGKIKTTSNEIAQRYYPSLEKMIGNAKSALKTAIKIAAAGNIIDFGAKRHSDIDIEQELFTIDQRGFGIFHYDEFCQELAQAKSLLYICDNAGEIVLDKILVNQLKALYPDLTITCAVREKPIINDATLADAEAAGLTTVARVMSSGSIYPGTIIEETSDEFRTLFKSADIIIAKGQGNFETLLDLNARNLFFILRIKCKMMAQRANTAIGNLVLLQSSQLPQKEPLFS